MKIRKLILRAKLEQIEKQNQHIFIFHCSATAAQWRFFKNFLYNVISDTRLKSRRESSSTLSEATFTATDDGQLHNTSYWLRGFTFFQSTSFKRNQAQSQKRHRSLSGPRASQFSKYLRKYANAPTANSMHSMFKPKGCLFFFDTLSHSVFETHKKNSVCLELVNKMESLEFNNNLILLYGQMNSTVLNHIDIKEALILDTRTTYQDFVLSMDSVSTGLTYCLHHHIDEFLSFPDLHTQQHSKVTSSSREANAHA